MSEDNNSPVDGVEEPTPEKTKPQLTSAFKDGEGGELDKAGRLYLNLLQQSSDDLIAEHISNAGTDANSAIQAVLLSHSINVMANRSKESAERLSDWLMAETGAKTKMSVSKPKLRTGEITKADDVAKLDVAVGHSKTYQMPLPGSGFRVAFNRPKAEARLFLDERLSQNIGNLGNYTYGASFSNTAAYMDSAIFQYFLESIEEHNIEGIGPKDIGSLRKHIADSDFQLIVAAMTMASNPTEVMVSVPCVSDGCNAATDGVIIPRELIKFDSGLLTEKQLGIITRSMNQKVTIKELEEYRNEFKVPDPVVYTNGNVTYTVNFQRVMLDTRCRIATKWCDGINSAVNKYLQQLDKEEDLVLKSRLVDNLLDINQLNNYIPFYKNVHVKVVDEEGDVVVDNTITGMEALFAWFKTKYTEGAFVSRVIERIVGFTSDNPVAVGVPAFKCSGCGTISKTGFVEFDVKTQFFTRGLGEKSVLAYAQARK